MNKRRELSVNEGSIVELPRVIATEHSSASGAYPASKRRLSGSFVPLMTAASGWRATFLSV